MHLPSCTSRATGLLLRFYAGKLSQLSSALAPEATQNPHQGCNQQAAPATHTTTTSGRHAASPDPPHYAGHTLSGLPASALHHTSDGGTSLQRMLRPVTFSLGGADVDGRGGGGNTMMLVDDGCENVDEEEAGGGDYGCEEEYDDVMSAEGEDDGERSSLERNSHLKTIKHPSSMAAKGADNFQRGFNGDCGSYDENQGPGRCSPGLGMTTPAAGIRSNATFPASRRARTPSLGGANTPGSRHGQGSAAESAMGSAWAGRVRQVAGCLLKLGLSAAGEEAVSGAICRHVELLIR